MEAELSEFSIDGCYRYHLNGKKDSRLGFYSLEEMRRITKFFTFYLRLKLRKSLMMLFPRTSLKDV